MKAGGSPWSLEERHRPREGGSCREREEAAPQGRGDAWPGLWRAWGTGDAGCGHEAAGRAAGRGPLGGRVGWDATKGLPAGGESEPGPTCQITPVPEQSGLVKCLGGAGEGPPGIGGGVKAGPGEGLSGCLEVELQEMLRGCSWAVGREDTPRFLLTLQAHGARTERVRPGQALQVRTQPWAAQSWVCKSGVACWARVAPDSLFLGLPAQPCLPGRREQGGRGFLSQSWLEGQDGRMGRGGQPLGQVAWGGQLRPRQGGDRRSHMSVDGRRCSGLGGGGLGSSARFSGLLGRLARCSTAKPLCVEGSPHEGLHKPAAARVPALPAVGASLVHCGRVSPQACP